MPRTKPDQPDQPKKKREEQRHLRADITPQLDEEIDLAVAVQVLRGNKELGDRSKLIRRALEQYIETMRADIERMKAAAAQNPTTAPAPRKPR